MAQLKITEFGNSVLRLKARRLSEKEITSANTKKLISDMRSIVASEEYGVGIAAPQVGISLAIAVIAIRPTPSHPGRSVFNSVIINPEITQYIGEKVPMWEGCISFGGHASPIFAQAQRHKKINVKYYDDSGALHEEVLDGFVAHVFQHEVDHLNGVLFVDRVTDPSTWMTANEYKKMNQGRANDA